MRSAQPSASANGLQRRILIAVRLLFGPIALLTLAALALHAGIWQREFTLSGPFNTEVGSATPGLILEVPKEPPAVWWRQPLVGDSNEKPFESILKVRIGGYELEPPHSVHQAIRNSSTGGFSHWGSYVLFALPTGVQNDSQAIATLRYNVQPRLWLTLLLTVATLTTGYSLFGRQFRLFSSQNPVAVRVRQLADTSFIFAASASFTILLLLGAILLLLSIIYAAASLWALAQGWALPTTALLRWSSTAQSVAHFEPYLGQFLLMCAGIGAVINWFAFLNPNYSSTVVQLEAKCRNFLFLISIPAATSTFIFSLSAILAGIARLPDTNLASLGGLIPFSDASNYAADAYDQARDGTWMSISAQRPLAGAFRSTLLFFADYSMQLMLVLQGCLLAVAACLATRAVVLWRGIWAGLAFFGLTYIYARVFAATTLTEPFGLFWALLSLPFFIQAWISGSVAPALVAFALTTVALMSRMGSMFTIPALMLWLVWRYGDNATEKIKISLAALGILACIAGLSGVLSMAFGNDRYSTGGNFAYVACGLTMGTSWDGCLKKLDATGTPLASEPAEAQRQLYALARQNYLEDPTALPGRLHDGIRKFLNQFPDAAWRGYSRGSEEPPWLWRKTLTAITLIGLLMTLCMRTSRREVIFWSLAWASILASCAIVFPDDGERILAASHPLMALFFAMGLNGPHPVRPTLILSDRCARRAWPGLIFAAVTLLGTPWLAHHLSPLRLPIQDADLVATHSGVLVLGGRNLSGFLVIADGQPVRHDIPSLHISEFESLVRISGVEMYQDLVHPTVPPLPFGFIFAPRMEKRASSSQLYIVPPEVLERRDVEAWRFSLDRWGERHLGGEYWFIVAKADPLLAERNR